MRTSNIFIGSAALCMVALGGFLWGVVSVEVMLSITTSGVAIVLGAEGIYTRAVEDDLKRDLDDDAID